ncbi:MAG: branched-chain amino acid ABC transporter permease [Solirubrobacteraceae bacterium]
MEAGAPRSRIEGSPARRLLAWPRIGPAQATLALLGAVMVVLAIAYGVQELAQRTINGIVAGSYIALGAVGLTMVYGTLKLVNFAHGDMLTFGAYMGFLFNVTIGAPIVVAALGAIAVTAALGVASDRIMWRPMRAKKAGLLQLLLMAIGLAFVIRHGIQLIAGTAPRRLDVDVTTSVGLIGLRIGRTELIAVVVGLAALAGVVLMLRHTLLGKQMRALSDNFDLAEVTGIDTDRIVFATWVFAAGLAGLAGVLLVAAIGSMTINIGFFLLLSLFAAVILGGIGNAYGAVVGGMVIGLAQEWSTLVLDARWKVAVGFAILIGVLIVRPQGIFGRERTL